MGYFILEILQGVLSLLVFVLIVNAVLSWLVAFDIINLRNRAVYQIAHILDAVSRPVLAPFQRFIPPLGTIDITPIVAIIVLQAARDYLLPWLFRPLILALGG